MALVEHSVGAARTRSSLPVEVCERIIDSVRDHPDYSVFESHRTLRACALTCSAWLLRSRWNLFQSVELMSKIQFDSFAKLVTESPHLAEFVTAVHLSCSSEPSTLKLLTSFPAVFARRLKSVQWLAFASDTLQHQVFSMHPSFCLLLAEFTSVTELDLWDIHFHTFGDFVRLICALPNITRLMCANLTWVTETNNPFNKKRYQNALKLRTLQLQHLNLAATRQLLTSSQCSLENVYLALTEDLLAPSLDLDLGRLSSLRAIALAIPLPSALPDHAWLPALVSQLAAPHLREIKLHYRYTSHVRPVRLDAELDALARTALDAALARTRATRVVFLFTRLFCAEHAYDRAALRGMLAARFPALHRRGLLDVEIEMLL